MLFTNLIITDKRRVTTIIMDYYRFKTYKGFSQIQADPCLPAGRKSLISADITNYKSVICENLQNDPQKSARNKNIINSND